MESQGPGSLDPTLLTADGAPGEDIYGASDVQRIKQVHCAAAWTAPAENAEAQVCRPTSTRRPLQSC